MFCVRPCAPSHKGAFPSPPLEFLDDNAAFVDCGEGPAGLGADQVNCSVINLKVVAEEQESRG